MIRARFFVEKKKCDGDYRPLIWPIQYPYWCTGENDRFFILVAYVNDMDELMNLWPEASDVYIIYNYMCYFPIMGRRSHNYI